MEDNERDKEARIAELEKRLTEMEENCQGVMRRLETLENRLEGWDLPTLWKSVAEISKKVYILEKKG
jgi:chromosome segregation ATPase|tara:strand:+ start:5692 stop:5892 length:201 start_codon:yes stop_codon:yes gene_type:complete